MVYIAPLKALVRERISDWGAGFCKTLGKSMVELTGGGGMTRLGAGRPGESGAAMAPWLARPFRKVGVASHRGR